MATLTVSAADEKRVKGLGFDFAPLYLQAAKLSEDGKYVVFRLSEQDGLRGKINLPFRGVLMNLLEDVEQETEVLEYKPFEILTVGVEVSDYLEIPRALCGDA